MYKNHKIVVWTPAGRSRYLNILTQYIVNEPIIDEYYLCINTQNPEDIEWMERTSQNYTNIHIKNLPKHIKPNGNSTVGWFYNDNSDTNTIYIKIDDDIVWLEDGFFTKLVEARINNPQYLFILPNIINNALIDHIHFRKGILGFDKFVTYNCACNTGWKDPVFAEKKHRILIEHILNNTLDIYRFNQWVLAGYERISINCLCYFGDKYNVSVNDEKFLTENLTKIKQKHNCVFGDMLCSHFSFWPQAKYMDQTNLLKIYGEIANDRFKNSNTKN